MVISPLLKLMTDPRARNRSDHIKAVEPRATPSEAIGASTVALSETALSSKVVPPVPLHLTKALAVEEAGPCTPTDISGANLNHGMEGRSLDMLLYFYRY